MVHAGRLAENLELRAGAHVFLDIESIPPGVSFPDYIEREIAACDVLLAMIGDDWLTIADADSRPRIADPSDWVHLELAAALDRGVLTIPVLVEGARMPQTDDLPAPLANLAYRNALELRDSSWRQDVERLIGALPAAADHSAVDTLEDQPPPWPARFTDSWFAANVPHMDESTLRALRAELYRRTWSDDEIVARVLIHAEGQAAPQPATTEQGTPEPRAARAEIAEDDPVAQATVRAAEELAQLGLDPSARVRERDLANSLARNLSGAVAERKLNVPGWDPQPGNVDVFTRDQLGLPALVIETKLKDDNSIFECLWDMAKVLSLASESNVTGAYLVTGTTAANWRRPVACAELFENGRHNLVGAIRHYGDWWVKYILGDSTGRPQAVPDLMDVRLVAIAGYELNGQRWELRAIHISAAPEAKWVPFEDGMPVGS